MATVLRLFAVAAAVLWLATAVAAAEDEVPFAEASLFFELNDTDGDLGIHASIDGEGWKRLQIEDPRGREILDIQVKRRLRRQGLTQLFFESAEPTFDQLPPEVFFRRFPEGIYEIEGKTLDGRELESESKITHRLAAPASGIQVSGTPIDPDGVDCDEAVPLVDTPVVIRWDPVTRSHPELGRTNEPVEVVKYQLVVEREDPLLIWSVDLPPTLTELQVPDGFIALGDEFKFEILVREVSGNQTAVESCFAPE